jgi:hypothetical protein
MIASNCILEVLSRFVGLENSDEDNELRANREEIMPGDESSIYSQSFS